MASTAPIFIKPTVIQFLWACPMLKFCPYQTNIQKMQAKLCICPQANYGFHDTHSMELTFAAEHYMDICCTGYLPDLINKYGKYKLKSIYTIK
jgi:hypothetical protein